MIAFLQIIQVETRREWRRARAYLVEVLADQALFTLGFLLLSGLLRVVAGEAYDSGARLASLVGFLTWRVADGCLLHLTQSLTEDAQWGTLEQLWLTTVSPHVILLARVLTIFLYFTGRALLIAAVVLPVLRLRPVFAPGVLLIFMLAEIGAVGVAFLIAGLHLVYKNVASITLAFSTALLFLSGGLAPLDNAPILYGLSRVLPLTIGMNLLRQMLVEGVSLAALLGQGEFYWLLVNTAAYALIGWLVLEWGQRAARQRGSLAHY